MSPAAYGQRTSADTEGDVSRVLEKIERSGNDLPILRLMANAGSCFRPFVLMSNSLIHDGLTPPRVREAVILHLAARNQLGYEWMEHRPMARQAGLDDEECLRLSQLLALSDEDIRAALAFVDDLMEGSDVAASRRTVTDQLGSAVALELAMVAGWWGGMVATVLQALAGVGLPEAPWPPNDSAPAC